MDTRFMSQVFQSENDIEWEDASPGIQRKIYGYNDQIMLVVVKFQEGAIGAVHQHVHTQVSYVESGAFELTIGEEKKVLKKGDGFFVPSNVLHGSVCIESGVLIDVFSPMREDFIKAN